MKLTGPVSTLAAAVLFSSGVMAAMNQPNVIVILTDDISPRNYALYGAETSGDWGVVSPVVETMAEQGLFLLNRGTR